MTGFRLAPMIAFDLDDTLAPSKTRVEPEMAEALADLLLIAQVCIISGGQIGQFRTQVLDALPARTYWGRLHLMPTCGTRYYRWDGSAWALRYTHDLNDAQRTAATGLLEQGARALGLWPEDPWGPVIEDRGSQITFSALGQHAPVAEKVAWDPDGAKKRALRDWVARQLPDLEVRSGGSTSIDVTLRGVDKAFGIGQLCLETGLQLDDIVFVGDRLDDGGNDYPVLALGVECVAVRSWHDTLRLITAAVRTDQVPEWAT